MPIDYSKYPPNWKSEIVPMVLKRAANKCEFCGLQNGDIVTSVKIITRSINGNIKRKTMWFRDESDYRRAINALEVGDPIKTKAVRVVLTVAHLDHDETNHNVQINRLRALCQYCHLNYDAKEKQRRRSS